jgi:putative SOS response-associated peptidase YedK
VAPTEEALAVVNGKAGDREAHLVRWGLVPSYAKDLKGPPMFNARSETIATKAPFKSLVGRPRNRCLVLADGFYEWQHVPGEGKRPFWITRADGAPFAFAGLWAVWRGPGADAERGLRTCTIVTTAANATLRDLHDRMPVMLPDAAAEQTWLAHDLPAPAALELLAPAGDADVAYREVGTAVNDARHDAPDCLDGPAPAAQTALF